MRSLTSYADMRGFTAYADQAVEGQGDVTSLHQKFLAAEFNGARERMTNLASTVGTAGSFVLVLVALLVGFAKGATDEQSKLVDASKAATLVAEGCSDTPSAACTDKKVQQAVDAVTRQEQRVGDLQRLNQLQAAAGGFVLLGFVLGLAGVLTNAVPGPDAHQNEDNVVGSKAAWKLAVDRLGRKKWWVIASLGAQTLATAAIVAVGVDVFT
jgi:hypothetical protein